MNTGKTVDSIKTNRRLRGRSIRGFIAYPSFPETIGIMPTGPALSIRTVCNAEQISGWPDVAVDFFRGPCIGVAEDLADELDGDALFVKGGAEIMAQGVWAETGYIGSFGESFAEAVETAS